MSTRCEDYPCCGHEDGGCPNSDGAFNCATCGARLGMNAHSSLCRKCMKRLIESIDNGSFDHDDSMNY